jgi:VanZ family protein
MAWLATTDRTLPELAGVSDKLNHVIAFLALGLLADRSFPQSGFGLAKIAALLAYGAAIEAAQYFLPYRESSLADILADAAGIGLYAATRPLFLMIPVFRPPPNG